ncbi:MAG: hypothetical protein ACJAVV_001057 [Alphaproteobacteria bacterium]|jgi:hypothetical protein
MITLMLTRGSHPIFGSYWTDSHSGNWERIAIVRYRSRRYIVVLFITKEFADASLHKWASLRQHERLLVQANHILSGIFFVTVFALIMGISIYLTGFYWHGTVNNRKVYIYFAHELAVIYSHF